jgi:hypothetical protein
VPAQGGWGWTYTALQLDGKLAAGSLAAMAESYRVYVDESGDEGFSFGRGSSDWFVLAAVVTRAETDLDAVKLVDAVRAKLNKPPKKPLHFRDLKHEHRLPFCEAISRGRIRTIAVLVHKPFIKAPEIFRERYRLYFYAVRFLLERVSWLCRDQRKARDSNDGTAEIIFSNRSGMSYTELCGYLDRLKALPASEKVSIDWNVISSAQVKAFTAGKRMGLQIADAIASGYFYAVQTSQYGHIETRYAVMMAPRVYRHRKICLGYGVKFWPAEGQGLAVSRGDWNWIG